MKNHVLPASRFTFIKQEAIITRKTILPILAALLLLSGCGNFEKAAETPAPSTAVQEAPAIAPDAPEEAAGPVETPAHPLQSLIFVNGRLYSLVEITSRPFFDQTEYALCGVLKSSVSRYEEPTEELTTNDEVLVGCEVHESSEATDALAVYLDDKDWIYTPYEPVPEEEKTYSFESGEELAALAVSSMEKLGYTQIESDKYELFEFAAIPEDCGNYIGVFETILEAPDRYRVVQLWYGTDPYRLLVLSQEHQLELVHTSDRLVYCDRTRSQLSPKFAWVAFQTRYVGASEYNYLIADLFSAKDLSDGSGDFVADIVGKEITDYPDYVRETIEYPTYEYIGDFPTNVDVG